MKKTSLIIHQSYVENVIKKLHETGMMEIIEISKDKPENFENLEQASMHSDVDICANYKLRVSRLIDILKKIIPKKGGIKGFLNPQLPKVKTVETRSIDEIFSYTEGILNEIERTILDQENTLNKYNEKLEQIKIDTKQVEYLKDFDFDLSDIKESEHVIIKAGLASDLPALQTEINNLEKAHLLFKQFGSGKKQVMKLFLCKNTQI